MNSAMLQKQTWKGHGILETGSGYSNVDILQCIHEKIKEPGGLRSMEPNEV